MEPWQSWTVVLIGGGAAWYYYNSQQTKRKGKIARSGSASEAAATVPSRRRDDNKTKAKRRRDGNTSSNAASENEIRHVQPATSSSVPTSGTERLVKRKGTKSRDGQTAVSSAVDTSMSGALSSEADADDGDIDNKEFARQLSGLKAGSSLAPPKQTGTRQRTMKQSRVSGSSSRLSVGGGSEDAGTSHNASATSSTTGADADDDLSPAASPALRASGGNNERSAGDVSDMLEAPAPGPSVLKITPSTKPAVAPRQQHVKTQQAEETKKQRQNRRKAEEKKAAREEAEKERRVLLEKQLRTSREAEGRPARNGLGAPPKPPVNSPWAAGAQASTRPHPANDLAATTAAGPLLDTFEHGGAVGSAKDTPDRFPPTDGPSSQSKGAPRQAWDGGLPSEEEQMKMFQEMDDSSGWNTVSKGRKGKKSKPMDASSDTTGAESSENDRNVGQTNGISQNTGGSSYTAPSMINTVGKSHPADSDWSVV